MMPKQPQTKSEYLFDSERLRELSNNLFDPHWWQEQNHVVGTAQGRGTTWFVEHEGEEWVLRHYYRGGLVGRVVNDRFFFTRLAQCRSFAEFNLLKSLHQQGLPVPRPIAARVVRRGLFYSADIVQQRIEDARDLVAILKEQPIAPELWREIGATLRRFHAARVFHSDLNSHNILLDDQQKVWLIDFDKGAILHPGSWQQENLDRLLRSLRKEATLHTAWHWSDSDWLTLLEGYA